MKCLVVIIASIGCAAVAYNVYRAAKIWKEYDRYHKLLNRLCRDCQRRCEQAVRDKNTEEFDVAMKEWNNTLAKWKTINEEYRSKI